MNMLMHLILKFTTYEKKLKKSFKNNKLKISNPTWNEEFELCYGSYSISDIQDYFEHIITKHKTFIDNPQVLKVRKLKIIVKYLKILKCAYFRNH